MKHGFSLIEFLVYLGLTSIFSLVLFRGIASTFMGLTGATTRAQHMVDVSIAYDLFARDMVAAPSKRAAWNKINEHELIWQEGDQAVGWCWDDGKVVRTAGTYDVRQNRWTKAVKSVVAHSTTPLSFSIEGSAYEIKSVTMNMVPDRENPMKRTTMVRNGEQV